MAELDLNNLVPDPVNIKIGEDDLALNPPSLRVLFVINKMVTKLQDRDVTGEDAEKVEQELKDEIVKLCPGLEKHQLNGNQILALANMVAEMSIPKTVKKDGAVKPDPKPITPPITP